MGGAFFRLIHQQPLITDADLVALEQRRDKTRVFKQGMLQALLTERVRLIPIPSSESLV